MEFETGLRFLRMFAENRREYFREYFFFDLPLSPATDVRDEMPATAIEFLDANAAYWEDYLGPLETDAEGYILVDATIDTLKGVTTYCTVGCYLARALNLKPLFLINERNPWKTTICRSYFDGGFVPVTKSSASTSTLARGIGDMADQYADVDNVADLLALEVDGVPVGELVYSSAMRRTGEGTFDELRPIHVETLANAMLLSRCSEALFKKLDIRATVLSHIGFVQGGVLAGTSVRNGASVYHAKPSRQMLRRYKTLDSLRQAPTKPSPALFDRVAWRERERALSRADEILTERFGVGPSELSREATDLTEWIDVDRSKPTVLVLPHIFIEFLRNEWRLFQDYLTWFRETIRFASDATEYNWVIKPHPDRDKHDMNQDVFSEVERITADRDTTIGFVPDDVSSAALLDWADVLLTMDGTAGIEYSCFGVPTLLASRSSYSGFEFTLEPTTKQAYFETLGRIDEITPLTDEQRASAKIMCYLHFDVLREQWPLHPWHEDCAESDEWVIARNFLEETVQSDTAERIEMFVEHDRRHLTAPQLLTPVEGLNR